MANRAQSWDTLAVGRRQAAVPGEVSMPQYVAIGNHAPSECAGANGKVREVWKKVLSEAPAIRDRRGIKLIAGPMHLDPGHQIMALLEASSQDEVQDYLIESRLGQIQDMVLYRASDLMQLFARAEATLPPLY
jgi:hypothetical protein